MWLLMEMTCFWKQHLPNYEKHALNVFLCKPPNIDMLPIIIVKTFGKTLFFHDICILPIGLHESNKKCTHTYKSMITQLLPEQPLLWVK